MSWTHFWDFVMPIRMNISWFNVNELVWIDTATNWMGFFVSAEALEEYQVIDKQIVSLER